MAVPADKIVLRLPPVTGPVFVNPAKPEVGASYSKEYIRICGTCGAIIAAGNVDRHISWHATMGTATVTTDIPANLR